MAALPEPEAGSRELVLRVVVCIVKSGGFQRRREGEGEAGVGTGVRVDFAEEGGDKGGIKGEFLFDFEEGHGFVWLVGWLVGVGCSSGGGDGGGLLYDYFVDVM